MDGGCYILEPEADNSLTILINFWYFSLEKHCEQVIFCKIYSEKKLTVAVSEPDQNTISQGKKN